MRSVDPSTDLLQTFDLVIRIYIVAFVLAVIVGIVLVARSCFEPTKRPDIQFMKSRIVVYKLEADDVPH